jgi:hypothetical protein
MGLAMTAGLGLTAHAAIDESESFIVSAEVPQATGIAINASQVNASTEVWSTVSGNTLDFGMMTLSADGVYLPDHYFAVDVGATGGAGTPSVTVSYTEGTNPNSPDHGLGWKSTATFVRVEGGPGPEDQTEVPLSAHGPKKLLKDLSGELFSESEISGGFFRFYLGIVTGDPEATFPDPAAAEVFTNADAHGEYTGTLLVSASIL